LREAVQERNDIPIRPTQRRDSLLPKGLPLLPHVVRKRKLSLHLLLLLGGERRRTIVRLVAECTTRCATENTFT
jgi:hypothetical protein